MSVAHLEITAGPDAGSSYAVAGSATLGRGRAADVVIADPGVSREHAVVRLDGRTVVVEDLDSANGTWVNGRRIAEATRLGGDETIRVGAVELAVRVVEAGDPGYIEPGTPDHPTVIEPAT